MAGGTITAKVSWLCTQTRFRFWQLGHDDTASMDEAGYELHILPHTGPSFSLSFPIFFTRFLILLGVMEDGFTAANFESLAIFRPAAITHNSNTPAWLNWISPGLDKIPKK